MAIMTNAEFIKRAKNIAENFSTKYMWGTFGSPITEALINQKKAQYPTNYSASRVQALKDIAGYGVWGFDCVGLIKGILWGWTGVNSIYGGATYASNGVPDTNADGMIGLCSNVSTNITSSMPEGSLVWMTGHIGIYIGNGRCVECTLGSYGDGVVISSLAGRGWKKCGQLDKFISYGSTIKGDVNADGKVDAADAVLLSRHLAGWKGTINEKNADMNGDGKVDAADAILLKRQLAGWTNDPKPSTPTNPSTPSTSEIHRYDYVKIKSGAKVYGTNRTVDSWVYNETWQVTEIINGRAVLGANRAGNNRIDTAFSVNDLTKA